MTVKPICPDCGTTDVSDKGELGRLRSVTIAGHPATVESGRMYRCNQCALAFRNPRLPPDAYVDAYEQLTLEYWTAHNYCSFWPEAERLLFQAGHQPTRILDIGCYTGDFLAWLKGRHTDVHLAGIEPAKEAAAIAAERGVNIIGKDISELEGIDGHYDAVILFDVFEHLPNIGESLDQALQALASPGILILYSGNYDAWTWRLMGPDYYYTAIPEHIVFTSPEWSRRFAERKGLELIDLQNISNTEARSRVFAEQIARNILYRISQGCERNNLGAVNALPLFRKVAKWPQPPGWQAAKDHLLVAFRK